jgi:hypothetical protein
LGVRIEQYARSRMFDRHRIWREVAHISSHLEARPREGYQVVVEVYLLGGVPFVVRVAETRRDPEYDWVKLYAGDEEGNYVFVKESLIERIEVGYRPDHEPLLAK